VTPAKKRGKHMQSLYLEPEKAEMLDRLSTQTRIPKAALLREAVDDLLTKHGELKAKRKS
jgi:predicted DNA-binding protein